MSSVSEIPMTMPPPKPLMVSLGNFVLKVPFDLFHEGELIDYDATKPCKTEAWLLIDAILT